MNSTPEKADRALLIWDAPNMDMGLSAIVGGRPNSHQRPRFDAAGLWLLQQADTLANERGSNPADMVCEATLFTNINEANVEGVHSWIDALRNIGFSVFAKPKETADSDVDEDMLDHLATRHNDSNLALVVVASADGRNFQASLDDLACEGVRCIVLGFSEECTWAMEDPHLTFVDVEEVDGLFQHPLPRMDLEHLPSGGAWLQPFRPLRALRHRATDRSESVAGNQASDSTSPAGAGAASTGDPNSAASTAPEADGNDQTDNQGKETLRV